MKEWGLSGCSLWKAIVSDFVCRELYTQCGEEEGCMSLEVGELCSRITAHRRAGWRPLVHAPIGRILWARLMRGLGLEIECSMSYNEKQALYH